MDLLRALAPRQRGIGYAYTEVVSPSNCNARFSVSARGAIRIWVNGDLVLNIPAWRRGRRIGGTATLREGTNALLVRTTAGPRGWGFEFAFTAGPGQPSSAFSFGLPTSSDMGGPHWLCLGPVAETSKGAGGQGPLLARPSPGQVELATLFQGEDGPIAWRAEAPEWRIRYRASTYADWFLSRGVLFLGLLRAADVTRDAAYTDLVRQSADFTVQHLDYFLWEDRTYGEPSALMQIVRLGNLDSCGAMGAAFADLLLRTGDRRYWPVVRRVADYIRYRRQRRPDGTFCRGFLGGQMVVDDLYMSCPFLVRMGKLTGDRAYYDDAVRQVLNFSRHLQDPRNHLYHHGAELDQQYLYPALWGRGNGWAAMAATEVLSYLPADYPGRGEVWHVLHRQLRSLLAVQAGSGMWRQLLDRPDSYQETSGTAMFTYSLARAVNRGWVEGAEAAEFERAARKAWAALEQRILPSGAVVGTCVGAKISSDPNYYYHLPTPADDDHGRGPLLMAGAEVARLGR